jgi:STE24 endopeptidase
MQSRKNEYQADNFTKQHGVSASLITALKKLSSHNMSNLTPHPWTVFLEYSHPPLYERVKNLTS